MDEKLTKHTFFTLKCLSTIKTAKKKVYNFATVFVNCSVQKLFNFVLSSLTESQLTSFSNALLISSQLIKIDLKRLSVVLTPKQAQIIITNDT